MTLEIINYLKNVTSTLDTNILKYEKGIKITRGVANSIGGVKRYVYLLNSMGKRTDKINKECNNLLLTNKLEVIGCGFQTPEHWSNKTTILYPALAEELYDGKLVIITTYDGEIYIYTKNSVDADDDLWGKNAPTIRDAVTDFLQNKFGDKKKFKAFNTDGNGMSYVFMYINNKHNHVTPYEKEELILLSIIDKTKMKELTRYEVSAYASLHNFSRPKVISVRNSNFINEYSDKTSALNKGLMLVGGPPCRTKVKNKNYKLAKLVITADRSNILKHMATVIVKRKGINHDICKYFPEFKNIFNTLNAAYESILTNTISLLKIYQDTDSMKTFSQKIKYYKHRELLFAAKRGKIGELKDIETFLNPKLLLKHTLSMCKNSLRNQINKLEIYDRKKHY